MHDDENDVALDSWYDGLYEEADQNDGDDYDLSVEMAWRE